MVLARTIVRQASFGAGEFSDRAAGRTDLPQYRDGLLRQENWITNAQGSLTRRAGFKYIGTCKTVSAFASTERASSTGAFDLNDVVYASELGLWVGVGDANGTNPVIAWSDDDGLTWTAATTIPALNFNLYAVCWSGSLFVAVGAYDGSAKYTVFSSTDGDTWTDRSFSVIAANEDLQDVLWTGSLFIAVGGAPAGSSRVFSSADGVTWTLRAAAGGITVLHGVARNTASGVLVADGVRVSGTTTIISTNGGTTWTTITRPSGFTTYAAFYDGGYFYLAGENTGGSLDGAIYRGTGDGTWNQVYANGSASTQVRGITRFGDYLVAVGEGGLFVYSLDDGATWTTGSAIEAITLNALALGNGRLTIVGDDDTSDAQLFQIFTNTTGRRIIEFIGATGTPYMMEFGHLYIRFWRDDAAVESSPGTPLEVATPWSGGEIAELQYAQANDVMYIVHPDFTPRKLTRTGEATFTLTDLMDSSTMAVNRNDSTFKFQDGPYLDENSTVTTITLSGTGTGSKTATASANLFASTDIGRVLRIKGPDNWGWGVITAYSSPTSATIFMVEDPNTTSAETRWALGAWSATTGYPAAISFYNLRLAFGGTRTEPMRVWASVVGDFEHFRPTQLTDTVVADDAVYFTIASRRMLPIGWLEARRELAIGTKGGGVFIVPSLSASRTPDVRLASSYGAAATLPAQVGDALVYVQAGERIVRGLSPSQASDVLSLPDLTLLAEHVGITGIKEMAFASTPSSIVWMRRGDGLLVGMTLNPVTQLLAWHQHQLPGSLTGADYPAVLSIAVLPLTTHDQLWAVVRRTVNSAEVETVEALQLPFDALETAQVDACYLDAAVYYSGPSTTAISGLDHLEGESVYAYADGIVQGPFTVSSGAITLTTAASTVWVGLDYEALSTLETLPVRVADATNAKVRVITTLVEVLDTNGLQIGRNTDNLQALNPSLQPSSWVSGTIKPLVTDDREHNVGTASDTRVTVALRPDGPLPATITGLTHTIEYDHV